MVDLVFWFIFMLVCSKTLRYLRNKSLGPFRVILNILSFIGVFVHEISHLVMNIIFGVQIKSISVKYRDERTRRVAPNGVVDIKDFPKYSLMQVTLGSIAPLFISTILFMFCLDIIFTLKLNPWINLVTAFFAFSLLIGSKPSNQDIRLIKYAFSQNPRYSFYQIFLVVLSILVIWYVIDFTLIHFPFDFLYYILFFLLVVLSYYAFKYCFRGLYILYNRLFSSITGDLKFFTRKRHKPIKPSRLGIEEPHW